MPNAAPFRHPDRPLLDAMQTHVRTRMEPAHDPSLRYAVPIPNGWGRATQLGGGPPMPGTPEVIGVFSARPDLSGPRVIVSVKRLGWEVDPLEWSTYGYLRGGWSVAASRWLDAPRADRFEVGGLKEIQGKVDVRRSIGFVDNGRLIRIDLAAPLSAWSAVHDQLWASGALFELEDPTRRSHVEARMRLTGPGASFCLPTSWRVGRERLPGGTRWVAGIDAEVQRTAAIRVDVTPRTPSAATLPQRRRAIAADLRRGGLALPAEGTRLVADRCADLEGWQGTTVFEAADSQDRFEVRIAQRETDRVSLDYVMLAPCPGTYHLDWMRAARALEIAARTTRV